MFNPSPWNHNSNNNPNPIVIDSESDDTNEQSSDQMATEFPSGQRTQPGLGIADYNRRYNANQNPRGPHTLSSSMYNTTMEQDKKLRSRLREERHAALSVLMDRELLTIQALAAQETLPQARRRFLAKLMAPEDPEIAKSIRAETFTIQRRPSSLSLVSPRPSSNIDSTNATSMVVSRGIVDVCETDDSGWYRPDEDMGGSSGVSSPTSSVKVKAGRGTPDRARAKGRVSSGRHQQQQQQQQRERRRRRWSGAERQDQGVSLGIMPP